MADVPKIVETDVQKLVEIRSMDKSGDSKLEPQTLNQAAQVINEQLEQGRWAYLDDSLVSEGRVTASDLEGVGRVILSNPIVGG